MLQTITSSNTYPAFPNISIKGQLLKRRANPRDLPSAGSRLDLSTDLSRDSSEAIASTSDSLGWQNVRLIQLRHGVGERVVPSSTDHCIVLQLGASLHLIARRLGDDRNLEGDLRPTQMALIPAGSSWEWHSQDPRLQTTLLLYLRPHLLGLAAAEGDSQTGKWPSSQRSGSLMCTSSTSPNPFCTK